MREREGAGHVAVRRVHPSRWKSPDRWRSATRGECTSSTANFPRIVRATLVSTGAVHAIMAPWRPNQPSPDAPSRRNPERKTSRKSYLGSPTIDWRLRWVSRPRLKSSLSTSSRSKPVESRRNPEANTRASTCEATASAISRGSSASIISAETIFHFATARSDGRRRADPRRRRALVVVHGDLAACAPAALAELDVGERGLLAPGRAQDLLHELVDLRDGDHPIGASARGVAANSQRSAASQRSARIAERELARARRIPRQGEDDRGSQLFGQPLVASPTAERALSIASRILRCSKGVSRPSRFRTRRGCCLTFPHPPVALCARSHSHSSPNVVLPRRRPRRIPYLCLSSRTSPAFLGLGPRASR